MRRVSFIVMFLSTLLALAGCKQHVACDPEDSEAVCKGFQDCLRSETSAEVCRSAEKDANKIGKNASHHY